MIDHDHFMARAIEIARERTPALPFAAVLIDTETEEILADGWNREAEHPLRHGETDALERYFASTEPGTHLPPERLQLYTTAEPCPMCAAALYWARVPKVVYRSRVGTLKRLGFDHIDLPANELIRRAQYGRLQVVGPVLEAECNRLFAEAAPADAGR